MFQKIVHKYVVPALYAMIWVIGLYLSQNPSIIIRCLDETIANEVAFALIFVVFLAEFVLSLLDLYSINTKKVHLSMNFILICCAVIVIMSVLFCSLFYHAIANLSGLSITTMWWIIITSTLLKFLETFIQNNIQCFIKSSVDIPSSNSYEEHCLVM